MKERTLISPQRLMAEALGTAFLLAAVGRASFFPKMREPLILSLQPMGGLLLLAFTIAWLASRPAWVAEEKA